MTRPLSDDFDPTDPRHWPPPPEPSARAWERTRSGITSQLSRATPRNRRAGLAKVVAGVGTLAAGVLIACGLWVAFRPPTTTLTVTVAPPDDPLAEYDVLPIATASDVMVSAVRGGDVRFGSINHPVPDTLPLASVSDVTVLRGPTAGEMTTSEPGGMAVYVMPPADK